MNLSSLLLINLSEAVSRRHAYCWGLAVLYCWLLTGGKLYTERAEEKLHVVVSTSIPLTLRGLQCFLTYLPEELCTSQSSLDRWTYRRFLYNAQWLQIITIQLTSYGAMGHVAFSSPICFLNTQRLVNRPISSPLTWFSAGDLWEWGPGLSPSWQGALYCHVSKGENNITHLANCHEIRVSIPLCSLLLPTWKRVDPR